MRTIHQLTATVLMLAATTMMAQQKKSKICITIDDNQDGKVTKVDTCFESSDPKEIDTFLQRMGVESNITLSGKGDKKIVIMNKGMKDSTQNSYNYSYNTNGTDEAITVIVDDNGKVITTGTGNAQVIVKEFSGDDAELDKEIETVISEAQSNSGDKTKKKEIKVIVARKVIISDMKTDDRKSLPADLQQVKGSSFESLNLYPNPSKGNFTINYKGNTSDLLTIRLFDAMGREVLMQTEMNSDKEFSKSIDVSALKKGIYFLQLTQGKKAEVKKVVITE